MHRQWTHKARRLSISLVMLAVAVLSGCSVLSPKEQPQEDGIATTGPAGSGARDAFTLKVNAPHGLDSYLLQHMELQRFRRLPDLSANEVARLTGAAEANVRQLLGTRGYFSPAIVLQMQETPESDAAPRAITITVEPGPPTVISATDIGFSGPSAEDPAFERRANRVRRNWSLNPGQTFSQAEWDAAKSGGLRRLQNFRYPTARIDKSRAEIDADTHEAQLSITYSPGPAYRFGPLKIQGAERYDPDGARRIARLPTGQDYDEDDLLDAQQRLASSGYYDSVFLMLDTSDGVDPAHAPVNAQVREAPLQKLVFGVGFSTDGGPGVSIDHTHNRAPGIGWRAISKLSLDRNTKLLSTQLTALPNENGWRWFSGGQAQRQMTGDYQVNSGQLRAGRSQSTSRIDRNYYLQYDYAHSQGDGAPASSSAVSANVGWTGRYFNNAQAPTRGWGLALEMGTGFTLQPERDPYVRLYARWMQLIPWGRVQAPNGSSRAARLVLRAEGGAVLARDGVQLPITQLFVTGGDTTVRGYGYRSIGASTDAGKVYGGRYLTVASAEWQRPIVMKGEISDWESAVFIDAGSVADHPKDLQMQVGVGAGVRWRSPVGPVQADLAYGLHDKRMRLHLRLGFTF